MTRKPSLLVSAPAAWRPARRASWQGAAIAVAGLTYVLANQPLGAQQQPPDTGRASLPVVRVLATPSAHERIPGSVSLVDSATLRQSLAFTSHEALRKVPGVVARDEEGLGLRPNFGIRGLNPTRSTKILLLEDGIPFSLAPYGDNASYYHPPIDRFDRVEVLKGSGQILFGPQTIGGIINYLTPDIPAGGRVAVGIVGGSRDYFNARGEIAGRWNGVGAALQAMRKQGDGARDNVGSALADVALKTTLDLTGTQSLMLKANVYQERSRVTYSGLTESEWASDPYQNAFRNDSMLLDRWALSAAHRARVGGLIDVVTTAYLYDIARDWWRQSSNSAQRPNDQSDPRCGGMQNLTTTCGVEGRLREFRVWGVEPRATVAHTVAGLAGTLDVGARFHAERQDRRQINAPGPVARAAASGDPNGGLREDNERGVDALSGFVQYRLMAGAWSVTPGLRVEHVRIDRTNLLPNTPVDGETELTEVIPGLGATYALGPVILFGGAHRGFAPPRPEDIIDNSRGTVIELEPELSWNYELGARSTIRDGVSLEATVFRLDFENQIVPQSVAGGTGATLTSAGRSLHQGVEFGARLDAMPLLGWRQDVFLELAAMVLPTARFEGERYAYVGSTGSDVVGKVYAEQNAAGTRTRARVSGNRLPYAPRTAITATLGATLLSGLYLRGEVVHTGEQFGDALNTRVVVPDGQQGPVPAATIVNLAVAQRLPVDGARVTLAVKNLFDRTYLADRTRGLLPGSPRLIHLGIGYGL